MSPFSLSLDAHVHTEEARSICLEAGGLAVWIMPESPPNNSASVKKALVGAGFEIFSSRGQEVILAERPRENLIMDSGVRLRVSDAHEIRIVFRAQRADFPNEDESRLFDRVRLLAAPAVARGFAEVETAVTPVMDPSDGGRTLDTFYEITYSKGVRALEDALIVLKVALDLEKRAESQTPR